MRILLLHHSTGEIVWRGTCPTLPWRLLRRMGALVRCQLERKPLLSALFAEYNRSRGTNLQLVAQTFPKPIPYGWRNYPFDYYNIWVKHAGPEPFLEEPTLELLARNYDVIVLKHCFPVANVQPDKGPADVDSDHRSLANYKLQYLALREKFYEFPATKFVVWTGAAQVRARTTEEEAKRFQEFVHWVIQEWDSPKDNLFVWDFYGLQTQGQLFLQEQFAQSATNSHPNAAFAASAAKLLFRRLVDVVETNGARTTEAGKPKESLIQTR